MFEGSATGILNTLFVLALLFFALWKTGWIRIVLSICIIIWGAFAMDSDIKVAAPLLGVGTMLFIMEVMNQIKQSREQG